MIPSTIVQCRRVDKQTRRSEVLLRPRNMHWHNEEEHEILPIGPRKSPTYFRISLVRRIPTKSGLGQRMDRCFSTAHRYIRPRRTENPSQLTSFPSLECQNWRYPKRRPKGVRS